VSMYSNRQGDTEGVIHDNMEADPFENMREQMERERDQFFKAAPREWPSDNLSRGGMFSRPRTSLGGFPGGSATLRPRFSRDPDFDEDFGLSGTRSLPRTQRHRDRETEDDLSSDRSSGSGGSGDQPDMSIPIRVFHERPKQRYGERATGQRSTTELPAKASPGLGTAATSGSESPRLERAASEPPNKFKQRLNISANPGCSTIPENSDQGSGSQGSGRHPQQPHLASERNPIKTSASAPSVPGYSAASDLGAPVAPPRRSPPRSLGAMSGSGGQSQPPPTVGSSVRHIPIFVEGRPEPIFNQNLNTQQQPQAGQSQDLPFSKPSEFYPPGVQRVRSREEAPPQGVQEPTTPLGPPPGPIPMGFVPPAPQDLLRPEPQPPAEPTTPLGPPPGPIPMGYVPREDGQGQPQEDQEDSAPPVPPQRHRSPPQPQSASIQPQEPPASRKSSSEKSAEVGSRKSSDSDGRKDPVVNVIPIRVEPGRPESPRPKQSSRHPSQEPSRSPVNVRKPENPQQPTPPPTQAPANPKIMKLAKIQEDVESLTNEIKNFNGSKDTKEYRFLEEMLTRQLLALDGIEPDGDTEIRTIRKESINSVNRCLSLLDRKVSDVTADGAASEQILSELAEKSLGDKKNDNQGSS